MGRWPEKLTARSSGICERQFELLLSTRLNGKTQLASDRGLQDCNQIRPLPENRNNSWSEKRNERIFLPFVNV